MGSLLGSSPSIPAPQPLPETPPPAPLPDEAALDRQRRRRAAQLQQASGRRSTQLSGSVTGGSSGSGSRGREFSRQTLG